MDKHTGSDNDTRTPLRRKIDHFWATLFLTPEGRPKSAMLLYAFCLCLVFILAYIAAYFVLVDVIEAWLGQTSPQWNKLLQWLVPGLLVTGVCSLLMLTPMDRRTVPVAYLWMAVLAAAAVVTMAILLSGDGGESFRIFWAIFAQLVLPGLLSGLIVTQTVFWVRKRKEDGAKKRPM